MKLSEHLDLSEVIRSESAKRLGINNMPNEQQLANLKVLAEKIFEPIRAHFRLPIRLSSGFRHPALNRAIGGASNSQHTTGEAIDIDMDGNPHGVTNKQIFDFIRQKLEYDQVIWEFGTKDNPDWVHVSYSKRNRKQTLRAIKNKGITQYIPYD